MTEFPYVNIHCHRTTDADVISVVSYSIGYEPQPDGDFLSAGIHPWYIENTDVRSVLLSLRDEKISAVGEIGLDYNIDTPQVMQQEIFRAQLKIAQTRSLPVIIHCVKAYNDLVQILGEFTLKSVILHGYIGSKQLTRDLAAKGYGFSYGPRSLASAKTMEALSEIPIHNIFVETDTSDTPVERIYSALAEKMDMRYTELREIIYKNFISIF